MTQLKTKDHAINEGASRDTLDASSSPTDSPADSQLMPPGTKDIVTIDEFAQLMRWNRKTVYKRAREGQLPGLLPGKPYRIHWPSVVASASTGQGRAPHKRGGK